MLWALGGRGTCAGAAVSELAGAASKRMTPESGGGDATDASKRTADADSLERGGFEHPAAPPPQSTLIGLYRL